MLVAALSSEAPVGNASGGARRGGAEASTAGAVLLSAADDDTSSAAAQGSATFSLAALNAFFENLPGRDGARFKPARPADTEASIQTSPAIARWIMMWACTIAGPQLIVVRPTLTSSPRAPCAPPPAAGGAVPRRRRPKTTPTSDACIGTEQQEESEAAANRHASFVHARGSSPSRAN